MSDQAQPRLATPTLCLVTDLAVVGNSTSRLLDAVSIAVEHGVNMVQIRAPELSDAEFGVLVGSLSSAVGGRALTIVNPSRRDVVRYAGVDGVQLTENATLSVAAARQLYGGATLVGRSVHSISGARDAKASGADYVVLGTIFPSATHPGGETHGAEIIHRVVSETRLPVMGIGGIDVENVGDVMRAGAGGIAVVRSILGAADPGAAARELWEAMEGVQAD